MTQIKKQYIPAPLASAVKNGYVADASEILDENKGKRQDVINQETDNEISGIKGGSTKSIADLSEDIANETERASGVEAGLRESIDELGQIGLDPDNAISTDGDDFDGDTTAKRSKIPTIGAIIDGNPGVYDVSKRNPTGGPNSDGTFTLEYILANADTLIPTSWRHGGMSISFVDSSDNNYVQYQYNGTDTTGTPNPFLIIDNWSLINDTTVVSTNEFVEAITDGNGTIFESTDKNGNKIFHKNVIIKGRIVNDKIIVIDNMSVVNTDEYVEVTVDNGNNIIEGINKMGEKVINTTISFYGNKTKIINDNEFVSLHLDNNSNIIQGIKNNGYTYLAGIESPTIDELRKLATQIKGNIVVVDANGDGDYVSLQECLYDLSDQNTGTPKTILLTPGTYTMDVYDSNKRNFGNRRNISIIGTNKDACVIRCDKGVYDVGSGGTGWIDSTPLKLAGNCYLANLTIVSTDSESEYPTENNKSYCIHLDFEANSESRLTIDNCRMVNNHYACVGIGLRDNYTISISNCEMVSNFKVGGSTVGTVLAHEDSNVSAENQHLVLRNNVITSNGNYGVSIHNGYNINKEIDLSLSHNIIVANGGGFIKDNTLHILDKTCFGNNIESMNY